MLFSKSSFVFVHIFQWKLVVADLDKAKKESTELQTQVRHLTDKLSNPTNDSNMLLAQLTSAQERVTQLEKEVKEYRRKAVCSNCKKVKGNCNMEFLHSMYYNIQI